MSKQQRLITRADLAAILNVSTRMVRLNEVRWGLAGCRVTLTRKTIRYREDEAMRILRALNVV